VSSQPLDVPSTLPEPWASFVSGQRELIQASGRFRRCVPFDPTDAVHGTFEGREVVNFASNDYLALTHHPSVVQAALFATTQLGTGAGASRLVTGTRTLHEDLEDALARWKSCEKALVFPTGYMANLGVIVGLTDADTVVFSDELNHASIVDGCRLSRARIEVYRHSDVGHVKELMGRLSSNAKSRRALVVCDSLFSMDGDWAPVEELAELCADAGALLVLDEAHAVLGPHPSQELLESGLLVRVGTLSKTLGGLGGFVAGSREVIEMLVNRARSFIFTTGLPPASVASALSALSVLCSKEGSVLLSKLEGNIRLLEQTAGIKPRPLSPVVPVVLGSEQAALEASRALATEGFLVPAIRPPTVPVGTSRLRVALSSAHGEEELRRLGSLLRELAYKAGEASS
jgi:8-amino-7-oxononanoate synthase